MQNIDIKYAQRAFPDLENMSISRVDTTREMNGPFIRLFIDRVDKKPIELWTKPWQCLWLCDIFSEEEFWDGE